VAPLEPMPDSLVAPVGVLGKDSVELAHALGEIAVGCLYHQVVVVAHQTPCVAHPVEVAHHRPEDVEKGAPVFVVIVDRFAPVAPCGNVVERTGEFDC
jgi:hypothetical protein